MKKGTKAILIILLILTITISIIGVYIVINYAEKIKKETNRENSNNEKKTETYYSPNEAEIKRAKELSSILKNNLPKMDGSTSTIPLEGGILAKLFDLSQEIAEASVVHSTTYGSFDNLINGKCDIIFSTPLSEEQYKAAKEAKVELVERPIVYEGFVFVVNAKNPVEKLTQQQIKDIYSGKITNWKEVGGNDAEIIAYQRNETSGSQNYMKAFMKDSNLMKPKTDFLPASMGMLMDAVATYDNAENAIGYSVYAYAADMYGNGNEIKFIHVDGVEPTKATMASGEYPLLNYNYAIYDKAKEETTTVDELVEWILTYDGQVAMVNAGYIPVKNIQVKEAVITPYTKTGTGKQKQQEKSDDYYYYVRNYDINKDNRLTGLKNKELQDEINRFIEEAEIKLKTKENECKKYVDLLNDENTSPYQYKGTRTELECKNGYLGIKVILGYEFSVQGGLPYIYDAESKVYDLYTGKELELSDLYYKDTEFIQTINKNIEIDIPKHEDTGLGARELQTKRTFSSVPSDVDAFGLDTIIFAKDNPYFIEGVEFEVGSYFDNLSPIYEARDIKELFENNITVEKEINSLNFETNLAEKKDGEYLYKIYYADTKNSKVDNMVNSYIDKNYINNQKIEELIQKLVETDTSFAEYYDESNYKDFTIYTVIYGHRYVLIYCESIMQPIDETILDVETGKEISKEEFETWRKQTLGIIE